jgi:hypothetical protein
VVGAHGAELGLELVDLRLELVTRLRLVRSVVAQGSGIGREASSSRPRIPSRSDTGADWPNAMSVAWIRFRSEVR